MSDAAPPSASPGRSTPYVIAAALLLAANMFRGALEEAPNGGLLGPRALGGAMAYVLIAAVAYGIAWFVVTRPSRGRTAAITVVWVMSIVLVSGVAQLSRRATEASRAAIGDDERRPLELTPGGLRHPTLGFTVPHPGTGFVTDTAGERQTNARALARGAPMVAWAFVRDEPFEIATVQVTGCARDEASFREFVAGARKGVTSVKPSRVFYDSVVTSAHGMEFRMALQQVESGLIMEWRCIQSRPESPKPFVACAVGMSLVADALDRFTEGLSTVR